LASARRLDPRLGDKVRVSPRVGPSPPRGLSHLRTSSERPSPFKLIYRLSERYPIKSGRGLLRKTLTGVSWLPGHSLGCDHLRAIGRAAWIRVRPPSIPTGLGPGSRLNLSDSDLLRQLRPLGRVVRRDHGIIGWQPPFLAILLGVRPSPLTGCRNDLNRLPSSRQTRKSGVIDLRIGTVGAKASA
jgi:hypothetical protein